MNSVSTKRNRYRWHGRLAFALAVGLSITYAVILATLPMDAFLDRVNYLNYAANSAAIYDNYATGGVLSLLANEPIWLGVNTLLAAFMDSESVVRVVIFISSFVVAVVALRRTKNLGLAIVFLVLPQVINNDIVHLRQGLAVAVFLVAWHSKRWWVSLLLLAITPFIHASFFFVVTMYLVARTLSRFNLSPGIKFGIFASSGLVLGLAGQVTALMLGARQGELYNSASLEVSGFSFLFWTGILILMILQGRSYLQAHSFEFACLIFYLTLYFISPLSGRIFEGVALLVLIAGSRMSGWRYNTFLVSITAYCLALYVLRINLPWFGFGA
jgi:hypothetical protein